MLNDYLYDFSRLARVMVPGEYSLCLIIFLIRRVEDGPVLVVLILLYVVWNKDTSSGSIWPSHNITYQGGKEEHFPNYLSYPADRKTIFEVIVAVKTTNTQRPAATASPIISYIIIKKLFLPESYFYFWYTDIRNIKSDMPISSIWKFKIYKIY